MRHKARRLAEATSSPNSRGLPTGEVSAEWIPRHKHLGRFRSSFPITLGCPNCDDAPQNLVRSFLCSPTTWGHFSSYDFVVPKAAGRAPLVTTQHVPWKESKRGTHSLFLVSRSPGFPEVLLIKARQEEPLLAIKVLARQPLCSNICAAWKASPETFHVSLSVSSSLSSFLLSSYLDHSH